MASSPFDLDLGLLSGREREVVDLAVDGRTDEQIAQTLGLSVSTVNSYWVRIRGKIGSLSRTEVVAAVLRLELGSRCARLEAQIEKLTAERGAAREAQVRAEIALASAGGASWPLLALENLPAAALIVRSPGEVAWANHRALDLLRMNLGDLVGCPVWELTLGEDQPLWEGKVRNFFADVAAHRAQAGVEQAHYVRRGDGTNFRATLIAEAFETSDGPVGVVTFREYLDDLDSIVRALRRPIALV